MQKIIYDIGANNGDNIDYYLLKSDLVIAVEANPSLCKGMRSRFSGAIACGKLRVLNCVVTAGAASGELPFYVHKTKHVFSQFPAPQGARRSVFEEIRLRSRDIVELINEHGRPYYIKIDVERYDAKLLRRLFEQNIRPPFISAESHDIEVFALLLALGEYKAFKLVDGRSVHSRYSDLIINSPEGTRKLSFPFHSAGPFGDDIEGPWMTSNNFFRLLGYSGLGWKDIHATNVAKADERYVPKPRVQISADY